MAARRGSTPPRDARRPYADSAALGAQVSPKRCDPPVAGWGVPGDQLMQREPEGSIRTVYTVGHSNHQLEDFFQLLRRFAIRLVVDVRSSPYARYAVQFNRRFSKALRRRGFFFIFFLVCPGRPA